MTLLQVNIEKSPGFVGYRRELRSLGNTIRQRAPDFDTSLGVDVLKWALEVNQRRRIPKGELFSDPMVLVRALVDLVGADSETLYAAILYPSIRPDLRGRFDSTYLDQISDLFKASDGVVREKYTGTADLAVNALQIRAVDLIALPHVMTSVEEVFDKPSKEEAEQLAAYFIMSRGVVKDERAFALRATQWYLRLVDMRENAHLYSQQERFQAYYHTDKFYSPFCEYLALQKLKDDPSYSPQAERKGLYRLKLAMDEELIRQINPSAYAALQAQLLGFLKGFEIEKDKGPKTLSPEQAAKAISLVDAAVGQVLALSGIEPEFVKFYVPICRHLATEQIRSNVAAAAHMGKSARYPAAQQGGDLPEVDRRLLLEQLTHLVADFKDSKGREARERNEKRFDQVEQALEKEIAVLLVDAGIPQGFVRTEMRLKGPRTIFQKVRAGRDDIHDYVGIRLIIDFEKLKSDRDNDPTHVCTKLHAELAKCYQTVAGRYRNLYVSPRDPDDGYRSVQNTCKIFGMDVEVQIVDLAAHINNSIGTASHFFHKLVGDKKGERKSGISINVLMKTFNNAGNNIVVRVDDRLYVLGGMTRPSALARRVAPDLCLREARVVVTDRDPRNYAATVVWPMEKPLRNGMQVRFEPKGEEWNI